MTGKGSDYEGWILRMIDKAEDIVYSYSVTDWLKFAADKIEQQTGQGITKNQIGALLDYRDRVFNLPDELGFSVNRVTRYRDEKGRWTSEKTAREVSSLSIRGEGNRFISQSKANELVRSKIRGLGIRKKDKLY